MTNYTGLVIDDSAVQKALAGTKKSVSSISAQVLRTVGRSVAKYENKLFNLADFRHGKTLLAHRYEYNLRSVFVSKYNYKKNEVNVYPRKYDKNRKNDITRPILAALSYGAHYPMQRRKYTHTIKARNFIQNAENYAENNSFNSEMNKIIEKELNKYWG